MYAIKQIMIYLDFSAIDRSVIAYTEFLHKQLNFEKLYFIHVQRSLDAPNSVVASFPELQLPKDEILKSKMQEEVF